MSADLAIEGGKALVKGVAFTGLTVAGTVITWFDEWSQVITTGLTAASFLMSVWYFRRMVRLKEQESSANLKRLLSELIQSRTKSAPPEDILIVKKYLDF